MQSLDRMPQLARAWAVVLMNSNTGGKYAGKPGIRQYTVTSMNSKTPTRQALDQQAELHSDHSQHYRRLGSTPELSLRILTDSLSSTTVVTTHLQIASQLSSPT